MHLSDEQLVAAYLDHGDQRAFRTLIERHQERIFGYLLGMVRDRHLANDLFQETFLRVIAAMQRKRGSYTQQGRWLGWVLRIARNATLDHFRSRKKWQDVDALRDDDDERSFFNRIPDDSKPIEALLHQKDQREWLEACIDRLSPEQREVVLLRHEAGLTFREIAELTECSINTALGRMRYALINLRKMLKDAPEHALADFSE
jgi:RNA polymerase sigma-70 factor (ECF subfamily)